MTITHNQFNLTMAQPSFFFNGCTWMCLMLYALFCFPKLSLHIYIDFLQLYIYIHIYIYTCNIIFIYLCTCVGIGVGDAENWMNCHPLAWLNYSPKSSFNGNNYLQLGMEHSDHQLWDITIQTSCCSASLIHFFPLMSPRAIFNLLPGP